MIFLLLGTITQIVLSKDHVIHDGGYCGTHAMPYRVSVNDQGRLKLSCNSLPSCIDLEQNDQSSRNQSKEEDETAVKCDPFKETVCSGELEWTAGLMEVTNGSRNILKAACCSYHGMKYSRLMKTIFLGHDDRFDGGLVQMSDNKPAFDVIKEVRKTMNSDHKMQYIVTVHRIVCDTVVVTECRVGDDTLIEGVHRREPTMMSTMTMNMRFTSLDRCYQAVAPQFRAQQVPLQQAPYQPIAVQQAAPAQYPSQYYPYYPNNPGLNTIFEQMQCFSGDMEVETPYGMKAIKDLKVGDMVLSIDEFMITFSPVIMFLHKLEEEHAEFLHIHTEQGDSLKLTENHLLYITNCGSSDPLHLTAAKEARPGQCLQITTENFDLISRRITSISKVIETGIYAPLTSTGDIVVNRYLVSCHSNLALKTLQQTFFSVYRSLSNVLRDLLPKYVQDDAHLPAGVHYLTTVADLFLPNSFL
ncbi:unnamed protein product [Haemonchus placei]|uniref:HintN domain-containing protein n=1 Tax=Haemonchus placei TaxID=6290 RepID=A0A0N4W121_HAEPC|nr:unnamed protein product [Haemonchus placei]